MNFSVFFKKSLFRSVGGFNLPVSGKRFVQAAISEWMNCPDTMNFYKHYIGDYQRDTGHLSLAEHGAYRLMLDAFYATGKPLPADKKALYRLLRAATPIERKAIDFVCAQFWETTSTGLTKMEEMQ